MMINVMQRLVCIKIFFLSLLGLFLLSIPESVNAAWYCPGSGGVLQGGCTIRLNDRPPSYHYDSTCSNSIGDYTDSTGNVDCPAPSACWDGSYCRRVFIGSRVSTYYISSRNSYPPSCTLASCSPNCERYTMTFQNCVWDETAPSVAYNLDANQRYTNASSGTFRTHVHTTDGGSGVAGIYFWGYNSTVESPWYINQSQGAFYSGSAADYYAYYDTPIRGEGQYVTRAHSVDNVGNWNWSIERDSYMIVDWTPPNAAYRIDETTRYTNAADGVNLRFHFRQQGDNLAGVAGIHMWGWRQNLETQWYTNQVPMNLYDAANGYYYLDIPIRGEGIYEYTTRTVDHAGNWNWDAPEGSTSYYYVDRTPPNAFSLDGFKYVQQNSGTTRIHGYNVTDNLSGIAYTHYWILKEGGAWQDLGNGIYWNNGTPNTYYDVPIYSGEGRYYVHARSYDNAGNVYGPVETSFIADLTAPTCTGWSPASSPWHNTATGTTFALTGCTDTGGSGLVAPPTCTTAGTNNATCTITVRDNAGNSRNYTSPVNQVDTAPPTCGTWSPATGPWNNTNNGTTFQLIGSSDAGDSGLNSSSTGSKTCQTGGNHGDKCSITLTDNAGNSTVCTSPQNNKETTPPVCGTWSPSEATLTWKKNNTTQPFTLSSSSDAGGSNINVAGGGCVAGNIHGNTCHFTISDHAGNTTICTSPANLIDTLSPVISASNATGNNWVNVDPSPIVIFSDPAASGGSGQSGIAQARYAFVAGANPASPLAADCQSGGTIVTDGETLTTPSGGVTLFLCVRDAASNVGVNQGRYNWENVVPTTVITEDPAIPLSGFYDDASPTITLTVSDLGGSGVNGGIRFQWNTAFNPTDPATGNLTWRSNNSTTTIPGYGVHTLYYQSRDNAGNFTTVESKQYTLNADVPTQNANKIVTSEPGNGNWVKSSPTYEIIGHFSVTGTPADDQVAGIYLEQVAGAVNPNFTYASFSAAAYHDLSSVSPPKSVSFTPLEGVSTAYYGVAANSKLSTLDYTTTYLDSRPPTGYFIISSPTGGPIDNKLAMHYSISDPLTGNFLDVTSDTNSKQNSGLALCEIQAASAPRNADGTIGTYSPFSTILSLTNCGTPEATNSAILFTDYTAQLTPGRSYLFHLNFVDEAGNTGQLPLLSAEGKELNQNTPPIISSYPPQVTLDPSVVNTDYLITPTSFQQAEPGTSTHPAGTVFTDQVVFKGTITDLDIGDNLTVSLIIRNPHDLNDILFTKETTLISNGGEQTWSIPVTFSELAQVIAASNGTLTSPLSNFEIRAYDGSTYSPESAYYLGGITLEHPPTLTNPTFTTDISPTTCPLNSNNYDLCLGALASFSAVISDPDSNQSLTFSVSVANPISNQSLTKTLNVGDSPLTNVTTNPLTFNYAELLALGENLSITYSLNDEIVLTQTTGNSISLYPAAYLISSLQLQIDARFAATIYIKDPSSLTSQGFIKLKDLDNNYQVWINSLYLYHASTGATDPNPHPFLVKIIPSESPLGIIKLRK